MKRLRVACETVRLLASPALAIILGAAGKTQPCLEQPPDAPTTTQPVPMTKTPECGAQ